MTTRAIFLNIVRLMLNIIKKINVVEIGCHKDNSKTIFDFKLKFHIILYEVILFHGYMSIEYLNKLVKCCSE